MRCKPITRHVLAFAPDGGAPEGDGVVLIGHVALGRGVEHLVLDEHHRVLVADGRLEQALGVVGGRRHHHFQAGDVGEPGLQRLRVLGGVGAAGTGHGAVDNGQVGFAAEHVLGLGGLVH